MKAGLPKRKSEPARRAHRLAPPASPLAWAMPAWRASLRRANLERVMVPAAGLDARANLERVLVATAGLDARANLERMVMPAAGLDARANLERVLGPTTGLHARTHLQLRSLRHLDPPSMLGDP